MQHVRCLTCIFNMLLLTSHGCMLISQHPLPVIIYSIICCSYVCINSCFYCCNLVLEGLQWV